MLQRLALVVTLIVLATVTASLAMGLAGGPEAVATPPAADARTR